MDWSEPHQWCDGRCARCPRQPTCALARRIEGARWRHRARGEDPDDLRVVMADVAEDMQRCIEMLREAAREEGIDLDAPREPLPVPLAARRLQRAGRRYAESLVALGEPADEDDDRSELRSYVVLTAMKLARLAGHLEMGGDAEFDVAPNRLLLERLDQLAAAVLQRLARVAPHAAAQCDAARRQIQPLVQATFGELSGEARAMLEELVARGDAPSPFCVRTPPAT